MKQVLYFGMAVLLFAACNQGADRYTQNSPEIDTVKQLIANYNAQEYDTSLYADSSQTKYNGMPNALSPSQTVEYHTANDANYSNRGFSGDDPEYEMVVTDDGETWVNAWLDWKGTIAATGKEVTIPVHLTYRFEDGKIVREYGYWDPTEIVMDLQAMEALNNLPPEENRSIVNGMYQSFAKGDIPAVLAVLDENVVWMEAEGNPWADGNPYKGPEAVEKGIFARVGEEYESFVLTDIQLHEMANDQVLATLRYDGKLKNGNTQDVQAAHLWTLKDGKVVGFQQYADTKQISDTMTE